MHPQPSIAFKEGKEVGRINQQLSQVELILWAQDLKTL